MTTLDIHDFADDRTASNGFSSAFVHIFATVKRWRARRRTAAQLAHLDAHLRQDVGVEFADEDYLLSGSIAARWAGLVVHPVNR
jgi:uncharacterized protein YjiS (DUF1127 family)